MIRITDFPVFCNSNINTKIKKSIYEPCGMCDSLKWGNEKKFSGKIRDIDV